MRPYELLTSLRATPRGWAFFAPLLMAAAAASCSRLESTDTSGNGNTNQNGGDGGSGSSSSGSHVSNTGDSGPPMDMVVNPDAGLMVQKMACGASTTSDAFSPGYPDLTSATSTATSLLGALNETQQANIMRGTPTGCGGSSGGQFSDIFENGATTGNPAQDGVGSIRQIYFRDGPRGVCMQPYSTAPKNADGSPNGSYATTFPTASARGASFDMDLEEKIGAAIGDEMVAVGSTLVLAPVINILRHPAWGRSQETYGEDSFELGRMGTAFVDGAQQYVPACVKHFAAYNIEQGRQSLTSGNLSVMDEQTAYESYGRHFEMVIQDGGVACVMAAYNKIQIGTGTGQYCAQNGDLLNTMLRQTFGFKGFVVSDWWALQNGEACVTTDVEKPIAQQGVQAGMDLEMPWSLNYSQLEAEFPATGNTPAPQITTSAQRIVTQQVRFNTALPGKQGLQGSSSTFTPGSGQGGYSVANPDHVKLAYQSALESMVLLKNDMNTLPIPSSVKTIAVIGANVNYNLTSTDISSGTVHFATDVRTGDLGSSRVYPDPAKSTGPFAGIMAAAPSGVTVTSGSDASPTADFYVVVAGMTPQDEGEGYTAVGPGGGDRVNFDLDGKAATPTQNPLIQQIIAKGKPMVVVLEGGSVINMPWLASVPAVVMAWYPGQDGGHALGDLLFGNANFSGKLPVTWPNSWNDEPTFSGTSASASTTDMGYYVGYKYFDKQGTTPLFPFGFGLSYTKFAYSNLAVPCSTVTKDSVVNVQVEVTNTGTVDGDEVSMLFASYPSTATTDSGSGATATHKRPAKELKAFHRSTIKAGQTVLITMPLRVEDLKYWDTASHSWKWENGPVTLSVGGSSDNLPLSDSITIMN